MFKDRKHSPESIEKMRQAHIGKSSGMCGKKHSNKAREKMRLARLTKHLNYENQNNPSWKGDDVGYSQLHRWVRSRLSEPPLCQLCNMATSHDLANITGIYNRDLSNWAYSCRRCHRRLDILIREERMRMLFNITSAE